MGGRYHRVPEMVGLNVISIEVFQLGILYQVLRESKRYIDKISILEHSLASY